MACISGNGKSSSRDFSDKSQFTYWVLDSWETCHKTPHVLYFIPGSLEDIDKYIGVVDVHYFKTKPKVQVQIIMCSDNVDPFIVTLHNILLAPDLCDKLFLIVALMNLE